MARLKSTYSLFVEEQEKKGFVKSLSHEVTICIDTKISKAFFIFIASHLLPVRDSMQSAKTLVSI